MHTRDTLRELSHDPCQSDSSFISHLSHMFSRKLFPRKYSNVGVLPVTFLVGPFYLFTAVLRKVYHVYLKKCDIF